MPRRRKPLTPDQKEAKVLKIDSVQTFKLRQAAERFAAEYTANPNMPLHDVLRLARAVTGIQRTKYRNCEQCSRKLKSTQMRSPCPFCGHNNHKVLAKEMAKRAKQREEEELRQIEEERAARRQSYGYGYW